MKIGLKYEPDDRRRRSIMPGAAISLLLILGTLLASSALGLQAYQTIPSYGVISGASSTLHYVVPDDFASIQGAINAIPSGTAGDVLVRAGTYDLGGGQIVVKSLLTLRGEGIDKTIIRTNGARNNVIASTSNIDKLTLQDFTVNQQVTTPDNSGSSVIYLYGGRNTNILIQRVKSINGYGAGIEIPNFQNITIQDNIVNHVWTGITVNGGSLGYIARNVVTNTVGDAIFPQVGGVGGSLSCTDITIENNYIENIGDTGIDITSYNTAPAHQRIIARGNTLKNAIIRVSYASDIQVLNNTLQYGHPSQPLIDVDNGAGPVSGVLVENNRVTSRSVVGIGFYGAQDSKARYNIVTVEASGGTQVGIQAGIRGTALLEGNRVYGGTYGIDFGGWGLGGDTTMTMSRNELYGFTDVGIYDDAKSQNVQLIADGIIYSNAPTARWAILTDYTSNHWTIQNNAIRIGALTGNQAINAPGSTLIGNYAYTPP